MLKLSKGLIGAGQPPLLLWHPFNLTGKKTRQKKPTDNQCQLGLQTT